MIHSRSFFKQFLAPQLMNVWSSTNFICPTPLLIFYKNEGAIIKYHYVIAYERGKPFKQFINSRTSARIQADIEGKPARAKLHKDLNNSCYRDPRTTRCEFVRLRF